jgi:hypothetical protein
MQISIFHSSTLEALQEGVNEFLRLQSNEIEIINMAQSRAGDELVITILYRLKETF